MIQKTTTLVNPIWEGITTQLKAFTTPLKQPPQSGVIQGKYYEREGSCHQCGECCHNIYLVHNQKTLSSVSEFEALQARDPEYASFAPMPNQEETEEDGLRFQCIHLQADKRCGIYEHRPSFCRKYPTEENLLLGGKLALTCGYRFRLLKNFQEVLIQTADSSFRK